MNPDRAQALIAMGKKVISIDINPLSRTSRVATVPICDEISRATANILRFVEEPKVLRFFFGRLEPVGDWQERLVAKFRADFGDSL